MEEIQYPETLKEGNDATDNTPDNPNTINLWPLVIPSSAACNIGIGLGFIFSSHSAPAIAFGIYLILIGSLTVHLSRKSKD